MIPVVSSSRLGVTLGSRNGALAHKSALAYAVANTNQGGQVRMQSDYLLEYLGTLVVCDMTFGVIENRDTAGVYIKASS